MCGNQGAGGSADCDQSGARSFATGSGTFQVNLLVTRPPAPCPCAIAAYAPSLGAPVTAPFTVIGAPTAPVVGTKQLQTSLVIDQVRMIGSSSWGAWFGAPPRRTLVLTVSNQGNVAALSPPLVLKIGRGPNPSDTVPSPVLSTLGPGASQTYQIPVDFPVLSFGSYMLAGQLGGVGGSSGFTTTTSSWPWGLFGAAVVLIQLILVWLRNRIRDVVWMRELRRSMVATPVAEGTAPDKVVDTSAGPSTAPSERRVEATDMTAGATNAGLHQGATGPAGVDTTRGLP